jgi:hypothetical protein
MTEVPRLVSPLAADELILILRLVGYGLCPLFRTACFWIQDFYLEASDQSTDLRANHNKLTQGFRRQINLLEPPINLVCPSGLDD